MSIYPYMIELPSYRSIFGQKPTHKQLINIVKQFPLMWWQNYLSRMQSIIGRDGFENQKNQKAIFYGIFSGELKERIIEFFKQKNSGKVNICYERQISTLQQVAFIHAPKGSHISKSDDKWRENLGIALLMTLDLMDEGHSIIEQIIQQQTRMAETPYWIYFVRAIMFYGLDGRYNNSVTTEYLSLFQKALNVDPLDHIFGGLYLAFHEVSRSNDEQASEWRAIPSSEHIEDPVKKRIIRAFEKNRRATPYEMRNSIVSIEKNLPLSDWNLISIYRFPLINFEGKGTFIGNLTALGRSLFDGIRHTILSAAIEKQLPDGFNDFLRLGGLYGQIFENYILNILEEAFQGRVIKIPENVYPGNADCLILFRGKVMVVEIKSAHFVETRHYKLKTIDEYKSELEEKGLMKGVEQIVSTIIKLWNFEFIVLQLPFYDWTVMPIIPVIIYEEKLPIFPLAWEQLYSKIEEPLFSIQNNPGKVGRLRFLTIDDIEIVPSINIGMDFATLLLRWGNDRKMYDYTLKNYLHSLGYSFSVDFMNENWKKSIQILAEKIGFDQNKINDSLNKVALF